MQVNWQPCAKVTCSMTQEGVSYTMPRLLSTKHWPDAEDWYVPAQQPASRNLVLGRGDLTRWLAAGGGPTAASRAVPLDYGH